MEIEDRILFSRIELISKIIFFIIMLLLAISLILQFLWRSFIYEPQTQLKEDVQEIQAVTEEIQGTVGELQENPATNDTVIEDLSDVDIKLDEVNEQLETLGEDLEVIETVEADADYHLQGGINQIFMLMALFLGIFSIIIAMALAFALNLRLKKRVPIFED